MSVIPEACTRCATPLGPDTQPDEHGWCAACRAGVVRTSSRLALAPAVLLAALLFWLMGVLNLWESRFVVVLMAIAGGLVWLAFKVARRVAFELVRYRIRRRRRVR
jgi:hypothetical protein